MLSFVDYETRFILKNSSLNLRSKFMYLLSQLGQRNQYIDWVTVRHPILVRDYSVPYRLETTPEPHPLHCTQWVPEADSPKVNRPDSKDEHSP